MNDQSVPADTGEYESRMWNAIAAFEQILEAMPQDRAALETLTEAYGSIGDKSKATEYMLRLAQVIIEEKDCEEAQSVLARLNRISDDSAIIQGVKKELETLVGDIPSVEKQPSNRRQGFNVTEEISLAWRLLQADQINEEEYKQIVQDLSDSRSHQLETPATVLHVLEDRQFKKRNTIIAFMR